MNQEIANNINIKVVTIIPYKVLPARLGGEKGIALFNKYLGKTVPLTAITTRNNDAECAENYEVLNIISNSKLRYINIFLYFTVRKILQDKKATHLIIEHPYYGWLGWMLKKSTPVVLVVHSHNIEYMRSRSIGRWWWKALKWYETWAYKQSDINFFISEDDLHHATTVLQIDPHKSFPITYGIEQLSFPHDLEDSKSEIRKRYQIKDDESIMLFNGALYHHTNYDALSVILEKINPVLIKSGIQYKILVCGKGLPQSFNELSAYRDKNIIYAGFVDDISDYFKAADIFLNPILSGGGVKTKAIEALAMNCTVISTEIGALGLKRAYCGNKLYVVADNDWEAFSRNVIESARGNEDIPRAFFDYYYWGNISKRVIEALKTKHA